MTPELEKALADVDKYGELPWPIGLQQAAKVLARAVRELQKEVEHLDKLEKKHHDGMLAEMQMRVMAEARVKELEQWRATHDACHQRWDETIREQAEQIEKLKDAAIPPTYHEGHECCRKCVLENAALKDQNHRIAEMRIADCERAEKAEQQLEAMVMALREPCLCMRVLSGDKRRHATGCHQQRALSTHQSPAAVERPQEKP